MDDLDETTGTYEAVADRYEARHEDRTPVVDQLGTFVETVEPGGRVLDAGCGPGWETEALLEAGYEVLAIDLTPAFIAKTADRAPVADVARMDMRSLGVGADAVDGIWACASFLHVPRAEADATLEGFARVLRDGGTLWLSVKRGAGTRDGETYAADDRRFVLWSADELAARIDVAGLTVERRVDEDWIRVLARA